MKELMPFTTEQTDAIQVLQHTTERARQRLVAADQSFKDSNAALSELISRFAEKQGHDTVGAKSVALVPDGSGLDVVWEGEETATESRQGRRRKGRETSDKEDASEEAVPV